MLTLKLNIINYKSSTRPQSKCVSFRREITLTSGIPSWCFGMTGEHSDELEHGHCVSAVILGKWTKLRVNTMRIVSMVVV